MARVVGESQKFQLSLRTMLVVITALSIGFALASRYPLVGSTILALAVSVVLCATLTTWSSVALARVVIFMARLIGIGVNLPVLLLGLTIMFIGLAQGTDTSVRENNVLAFMGFSIVALTVVSCLALFVSRRPVLLFMLAASSVGNGILLIVTLYHLSNPTRGGIEESATLCGVAFVNIIAGAIGGAYHLRFHGR